MDKLLFEDYFATSFSPTIELLEKYQCKKFSINLKSKPIAFVSQAVFYCVQNRLIIEVITFHFTFIKC